MDDLVDLLKALPTLSARMELIMNVPGLESRHFKYIALELGYKPGFAWYLERDYQKYGPL